MKCPYDYTTYDDLREDCIECGIIDCELKISTALSNILYERKRQDEKWGEQNHHPYIWLAILIEEIGEASKYLLENDMMKYRDEMVHVAAVALAAIEAFDRKKERK